MEDSTHLSLEGTLTSLYAPELRFNASSSSLQGKEISISGTIGGQPISIIHASGCSPRRSKQNLLINSNSFSFILACDDIVKEAEPVTGIRGLRSLFAGLYPFDSQVIELNFKGLNFHLTTSLHIEIPHLLTRYYKGTENLQHVFSEGGLRAVSYMGGICEDGEGFRMHLHYKSLDAFRRIANPALTMISVAYLDLAAILTGGSAWRDNPAVIFGLLCINATALGSLAAIRVGSTLRSLLNMARLAAVIWVLIITFAIRTGGLPGIGLIVDIGIKGAIMWLLITSCFSFLVYPLEDDSNRRGKKFAWLSILCFLVWAAWLFIEPLAVAKSFSVMRG